MRIVRIGLYCVIGIVCAMLLLELFVPNQPDQPTWPELLLLQHQAFMVQAEESRREEAVAQAGQNEDELEAKALEASEAGHFLQAYKYGMLIKPGEKRNAAMQSLYKAAATKCNTLGWALAALENQDSANSNQMQSDLLTKWEQCQATPE